MNDEAANALTGVETDSLVCAVRTAPDCGGGGTPLMFHNRPFNVGLTDAVCPTLSAEECSKAPGQTLIQPKRKRAYPDVARSLTARADGSPCADRDSNIVCFNPQDCQSARVYSEEGVWHSLNANENGGQSRDAVLHRVYGMCSYASNAMKSDNPRSGFYEAETARTLDGNGGNPACNQGGMMIVDTEQQQQQNMEVEPESETECEYEYEVRRLTELECERLQGYEDGWTLVPPIPERELPFWRKVWDGYSDMMGIKKKSDRQILKWMADPNSAAARYKALGNSIGLPFWHYLAQNISEHLPEDATMGSLFDGIGGFPKVFQMCGVKPVWASEVEPFAIAVTRHHFKDEETDD